MDAAPDATPALPDSALRVFRAGEAIAVSGYGTAGTAQGTDPVAKPRGRDRRREIFFDPRSGLH